MTEPVDVPAPEAQPVQVLEVVCGICWHPFATLAEFRAHQCAPADNDTKETSWTK